MKLIRNSNEYAGKASHNFYYKCKNIVLVGWNIESARSIVREARKRSPAPNPKLLRKRVLAFCQAQVKIATLFPFLVRTVLDTTGRLVPVGAFFEVFWPSPRPNNEAS